MPTMYDNNTPTGGGYTPDSMGGEGKPPATPAPGASNVPGEGNGLTPTSTPPATTQPQTSASISEMPMETLTPPERALKSESWGTKLYHGVLNALGGGGDVSYSRDASGKMVATPVQTGPGTQWKKIIAGALSGFGAAAQAGTTGPGGGIRGAGAGVQAGMKMAQDRDQQGRAQANEDFEAQQKLMTASANRSLMASETARNVFSLEQGKIDASIADAQLVTNFQKLIHDGGEGSKDLGTFHTFDDVVKAFKEMPELHDAHANGMVFPIPNIVTNPDGTRSVKGIRAAYVTSTWLQAQAPPLDIHYTDIENGKPVDKTYTTQGLNNEQAMTMTLAQANKRVETWKTTQDVDLAKQTEQSQAKLRAGQTAEAYAKAEHDRAESRVLNEASDQNTMNSNAQQLVEGSMDPSNLSKRSKTYDATLSAANAYSMGKYGKPFDVAKAASDYKFASNPQTKNTLNFLNSLTGRDNQTGNLGEVIRLSDGLKRSQFPPLNRIDLWTKAAEGDPAVTAYRTALIETADQAAKILQGGGTGSGTSDKKLDQALELLNGNFNAKQMRSAAEELRVLLANRKREVIGDNRYLMQWNGLAQPAAAAQPGAQPAAPAAAAGQGQPTKFISLSDARKLPQYIGKTDDQITADAKGLGYGVKP